jgi:lipoprotein-releasing system permease protein
MFWGNIAGILICLVQHYFGIIKLDQSSYYLSTVPINLSLLHILLINLGTLLLTITMLIIPSAIISRILPVKTIRFD